jgi:hypothetical protein
MVVDPRAITQRDLLVLGYLEGAYDYLRRSRDERARQIIESHRARQPTASPSFQSLIALPPPPFSLSALLSPTPSPSPVAAAVRAATLPIEHRTGEIRRSAGWYLERCPTDESDRAVLRGMEAAPAFGPWFPYGVVDRLARVSEITPVRAAQLRYIGFAIAAVVEPQLLPNGKAPPLAEPMVRAACAEIGLDPGRLVGALSAPPDRDPIALVTGSVWIALGGAGVEAPES